MCCFAVFAPRQAYASSPTSTSLTTYNLSCARFTLDQVQIRKPTEGVFTWENSHRREFHTGMTSWLRIKFTWWMGHFISRFEGTLHVHKIHVWFKIANITHTLPVPVYQQTDFTPKCVVVSRLYDTVARFRTVGKFSPVTTTGVNSRRGYSRLHDILWWYHVNKCRAMRGNRSELIPARKSPRSCQPGWEHKNESATNRILIVMNKTRPSLVNWSHLFHLVQFLKCRHFFLEVNS